MGRKCARAKHLALLIYINSIERTFDKCYSSYKTVQLLYMQSPPTEPTFHCKVFVCMRWITCILFHNMQGKQRKLFALSLNPF